MYTFKSREVGNKDVSKWKEEKERILALSLEEKRKVYAQFLMWVIQNIMYFLEGIFLQKLCQA